MYKKLLPTNCGKIHLKLMDKIYGGTDMGMTDHPWLVGLIYKQETNELQILCSGSIITDRFVLTAAQWCLFRRQKPDFVRIGEWQISTDEDCAYSSEGKKVCNPKHLDVGVNKFFIHEDYNRIEKWNDIGLIRTENTILFNLDQNNKMIPLAMPVCLPSIDEENADISDESKKFDVVGWGEKFQSWI